MTKSSTTNRPRGRPRLPRADIPGGNVQALERGLILLSSLANDGNAPLNDLAIKVGIPPSTAHRLLVTLQNLGFADYKDNSQTWAIGIETFRVGNAYLDRTNLVEASRGILRDLMEQTGETANLAIADQGDVVFLSQVETQNPIRAFFRPGARGQMHASGIGKALLANLPRLEVEKILHKKGLPEFTEKTLTSPDDLFSALEQIRQQGWSLDDEERYLGMRCVAAPVYNSYGEAIAGISVSGPAVRFPDNLVYEIGPQVRRSALEVTQLIGGRAPQI